MVSFTLSNAVRPAGDSRRAFAAWCFCLCGFGLIGDVPVEGADADLRVRGVVLTVDRIPLPGVEVRLGGETIAVTDSLGRFDAGVAPAGAIELEFVREGFHTERVSVGRGSMEGAELMIELMPLTRIEKAITVSARRELRVIQKEASVRTTGREDLESSPGRSAADAIETAPGVTIQRDKGEADEIFIRGMEPRLISTMIDGERIPAPDGDDRTAGIFMIPVELIEAIEVQTTFTPEMDADVIGGSVNLLTRKTPAEGLGRLSLGAGFDHQSSGALHEGTFTLGRLLADRLGALVSFGEDGGDRGSDRLEIDYGDESPIRSDLRDYRLDRRRTGVLLRLDLAPSLTSDLSAKGFLSEFDDDERRSSVRYDAEESTIERQSREAASEKSVMALDLAGIHTLSRGLRLGWRLGWFEAEENAPDRFDLSFVQEDVAFVEGGLIPAPVDQDLDLFVLDEVAIESSATSDQNLLATFDFAIPVSFQDRSSEVRAGMKLRRKDKSQNVTRIVFESEDEIPLTDFIDGSDPIDAVVEGYPFGPMIDQGAAMTIIERFGLEGEHSIEDETADYDASEDSDAAYALIETSLGARSSVLAGVRYERTRSSFVGFEIVEENDEISLEPVTGGRTYEFWMPSVLLAHEVSERTWVKGGLSRTFARPDFIHLVPFTQVDEDDLEIEKGNPDLRLTTAWNADLSVEWESLSGTSVSLAAYYKAIDDFIFESRTEVEFDDRTFNLIQPANGTKADLVGIEVGVRRRLRGTSWMNGFGFEANLAWSESSATIPSRPGETIAFPGHADLSGDLSIGWATDRVELGVTSSYVSEQLLELGESRSEDLWSDDHLRVDLYLGAPIGRRWELILRANNLTNEPVRLFEGEPARPALLEHSGWSASAGVRVSL